MLVLVSAHVPFMCRHAHVPSEVLLPGSCLTLPMHKSARNGLLTGPAGQKHVRNTHTHTVTHTCEIQLMEERVGCTAACSSAAAILRLTSCFWRMSIALEYSRLNTLELQGKRGGKEQVELGER